MFKLVLSALLILGLVQAPTLEAPQLAQAVNVSPDAFKTVEPAAKPVLSPRMQAVRLVLCGDKTSQWWGTMVHVGHKRYLSVHHVAGNGALCFDAATGVQLKTIHDEPSNDFAIIEAPRDLDNYIYKTSCKPFVAGQHYTSIGWAEGQTLSSIDLKATRKYSDQFFIVEGQESNHLHILKGKIIPGMSGGPMVDKDWVIHGMNNIVYSELNNSYSRELRDTAVCK